MSVAAHHRPPRAARVRRLALVAAVAAVAVVVAAIVSSSGGSPSAPAAPSARGDGAPAPSARRADAPTNALFAGLRERDGVLGDPAAPVTVTEFADLQCPVCAAAARTTLPALIRDDVRTGKVKLDARLLQFIGPDSVRAAQVAAGARAQGKLWPFLAAFYAAQGQENTGYATDAFLRGVATAAGVDAGPALEYATTADAQDALNRANAEAQTRGVSSTPTFLVTGPGGRTSVVAGHDDAALTTAIREATR